MDWDATVIPTFCYGAADLIERPDLWNNQSKRQSEFDKHLQRGWNKCEAEGRNHNLWLQYCMTVVYSVCSVAGLCHMFYNN